MKGRFSYPLVFLIPCAMIASIAGVISVGVGAGVAWIFIYGDDSWPDEDIVGIAENKQLVRSFYAAGNRGDFDACFDLIAEGDLAVALTSGVAKTFDGRPYNNRHCQVMRIKDGRIVEVTECFDTQLTSAIFGND